MRIFDRIRGYEVKGYEVNTMNYYEFSMDNLKQSLNTEVSETETLGYFEGLETQITDLQTRLKTLEIQVAVLTSKNL